MTRLFFLVAHHQESWRKPSTLAVPFLVVVVDQGRRSGFMRVVAKMPISSIFL